MSDTEVAEPTPALAPVSPAEAQAPTTPIEEQAAEPGRTETPPEPELPEKGTAPTTYEDWQAQLEAAPDIKAAHEEREAARVKELRKEEYNKFRSAIQEPLTQSVQASAALVRELQGVNALIRQGVASGALEPEQVAPILANVNLFGEGHAQGTSWLLAKMGQIIEDEPLALEFSGRIQKMAQGRPDPDFANDLLKRLVEPTIESGYVSRAKYEADLKKTATEARQAALNEVATKERAKPGNNPDLAPKAPGGGGYRTKAEARTLHAQGKIGNEEMRRVRSDPNIPD